MDLVALIMAAIALVLMGLQKLAAKTETKADDLVVKALQDPRVQEIVKEYVESKVEPQA